MWRFVFVVAGVVGGTAAVLAQDAPQVGPHTRAAFPPGVERCYRAGFDGVPLATHTGQILKSFQLYRLLRPNPIKETIDAPLAEAIAADQKPDQENWTDVVAELDGKKGLFRQTVVCSDGEAATGFHCYVECDGGSFDVAADAKGLGIRFEENNGLALNESCGDPDEEGHDHILTDVEAGHAFTLAEVAPDSCVAIDQAARPAFAADPVPLRTRIAQNGWTCLSRRYDAAHLAKHPKQNVVAMALALKGPVAAMVDSDGWRTTEFAATLSLKMRNGKSASTDVACVADDYQYRCGGAFRLRRNDSKSALLLAGEYGGEGAETPEALNGLKLGLDDLTFRLDGGQDTRCRAE